jgi:hypothetical protein
MGLAGCGRVRHPLSVTAFGFNIKAMSFPVPEFPRTFRSGNSAFPFQPIGTPAHGLASAQRVIGPQTCIFYKFKVTGFCHFKQNIMNYLFGKHGRKPRKKHTGIRSCFSFNLINSLFFQVKMIILKIIR